MLSSVGAKCPLFTPAPRSRFEPGFESGSTGADPRYIHTGSKGSVVNNCIPEVFIDSTRAYLVQNKMATA